MTDKITVLVPTSPIPIHPNTETIEKALDSVRVHLPTAQILILADGVRPEQEHRRGDYQSYLLDLTIKLLRRDRNVGIVPFPSFLHQAGTASAVMDLIRTPLILYMEHDTFFLDDLPIDWEGIGRVIEAGDANMVMFHHQWEPWIIPEHEHLMLDKERNYFQGIPMVRTWQWSQRPHVASTDFYRKFLKAYFTPQSRTFIEDRMYEVVMQTKVSMGDDGWHHWKLMYYAPTEGNTIRRTWTVDGRGTDEKYPMIF